jgi:hypothetical protein
LGLRINPNVAAGGCLIPSAIARFNTSNLANGEIQGLRFCRFEREIG